MAAANKLSQASHFQSLMPSWNVWLCIPKRPGWKNDLPHKPQLWFTIIEFSFSEIVLPAL